MSRTKKFFVLPIATILLLTSTAAFGQTNKSGDDEGLRGHGALGVLLRKTEDGVTVVGVIPGSGAARAGIRWGDEIRNLGDRRIRTTQEFTEAIQESKPETLVELRIFRKGQSQDLKATLGSRESTFGPANPSPSGTALDEQQVNVPANSQQSSTTKVEVRDLNQQVRLLNQQIDLLHQQLNVLSTPSTVSSSSSASVNSNEADEWWNRNQRGDTHGDPALFQ